MKPFYNAGILAGSAVLLLSAAAAAQGQPAPAPAPTPATTPATAPVEATPAPGTAADATAGGQTTVAVGTEAAAEADATATPVVEPKPEPVPEPTPEPTPEPEAAPEPAKSPFSFSVFVDANYAIQTAQEGTPAPLHRAYEGSRTIPIVPAGAAGADIGAPQYRLANDTGFGIALAGTDLVYDGGNFGATVSLRFGNAMQNYHFNTRDSVSQGTIPLTQAYATWKPSDMLTLDLGMFGTIFGAEVLETWRNLNYSRSGLYFAMQPFWHTGLRAALQVTDALAIKVLVVNDTNTSWNYYDPNANAPVGGLQFAITPVDEFSLYIGGLVAEDGVTSGFETFADLLAIVKVGGFTAIFNGDANFVRTAERGFGGLSLTLGYQFTPLFGIAYREDLLLDPSGTPATLGTDVVQTHTLTFDVRPIVDVANLVLRAEGRIDNSPNGEIFFDGDSATTSLWGLGLVSMVVNTDGL